MGAVQSFPLDSWQGPFPPDLQHDAVTALETGHVLFFPALPFALSAEDRAVLDEAGQGKAKNISYDPATGHHKGTDLTGDPAARIEALMKRYADSAAALLRGLAPGYGAGLECARTSFRPAEIADREMPWRKDDKRLHVDAFPSRPMRGRRILRVFSNVDPAGTDRHWRIGEPFANHAARLLPQVQRQLPGTAAVLALAGITRGRRSAYDELMLGLHDAAKRDTTYQASTQAEHAKFPPGTTWMTYTDLVPHAAMAGRQAFEQTFHLAPDCMADPDQAPLRILERLTHRALV
jgi:3-deoxy-D-manno-oct-2-ulosonic acid (Kdo) hydroxylase